MGIESFLKKLNRSEAMLSQELRNAKGEKFMKKYDALELVRNLKKSADDLVKPGNPGNGGVSEWTLETSRPRK